MTRSVLPAIVGGTLVLSLGLSWCRGCRAVDEQELELAATAVRESFRAGDLIVVEPHTLVRPRQRLGDLPLVEPVKLAPDDLLGVQRVHLLETGAIGSDRSSRRVLESIGKMTAEELYGGVRVSTFELAGRPLIFDLRAEVERARVTARYPDGQELPCDRYSDGRWACPRDSAWSWVGRAGRAIDDQPRECVWMHPLHAGGVLRIELPRLPLDEDAELVAHFGFTLDASNRAAAPVRVALRAGDDTSLAEETFSVQPGWRPLRRALAKDVTQPLRLELTTTNNGAAHFCGSLLVLGGEE
jgi:hypothetical protein